MSLINDALKQTSQSRQESPSAGPPPLPPAESASKRGVSWLVPLVIVLFLIAAGIFLGQSLHRPAPLFARTVPTNHGLATVAPAVVKARAAAVVPAIVSNPPPTNVTVVAPPKPPEPKLQGILFAASRPCAIVSGKTVFVGDRVGEFRVAAIFKDSIKLQNGTKIRVMSLNPY